MPRATTASATPVAARTSRACSCCAAGDLIFNRVLLLVVVGFFCLLFATDAFAWGPTTHIRLANDLLAQLSLLPAAVSAMLARHARSYIYGNVAADVVFAKKLSRVKQICHHWTTGFSILDQARDEEERAFAYGYLSHLAADTVAHGKYLPRQMALSGSTINFGHLYWEVRADAQLPAEWAAGLRQALAHDYPGPQLLLEKQLGRTLLPFEANQRVFNRLNLLVSMKSWQRSVEFWGRWSRWPLPGEVLDQYRAESLERMMDVLRLGSNSLVLRDDPNGNSALAYARAQRRQLRQMRRAGLPLVHAVAEAAATHAPGGELLRQANWMSLPRAGESDIMVP